MVFHKQYNLLCCSFSFTLRKLKKFFKSHHHKMKKANKVVIIKGQFLPDGKTLRPTSHERKKKKDPKNTHKKNRAYDPKTLPRFTTEEHKNICFFCENTT